MENRGKKGADKEGSYMKIRNLKKEYLLAALLIGILLMVIVLPTKEEDPEAEKTETDSAEPDAAEQEAVEEDLETRLQEMLASMQGVGKVRVLITWKSTGERVVEKDRTTSEQKQEAEGEQSVQSDTQEQTVFYDTENGSTPYIVKEVAPSVKGVLVIAEGADDPVVVQNITDSIMALFSIESHKIKVVRMKEG